MLLAPQKAPPRFRAVRDYLMTQNTTSRARRSPSSSKKEFASCMADQDYKEGLSRLPSPGSTCLRWLREAKAHSALGEQAFSLWQPPTFQKKRSSKNDAFMTSSTPEHGRSNSSASTSSVEDMGLSSGQENGTTSTAALCEQSKPLHSDTSTGDEPETPRSLHLLPTGQEPDFCLSNVSCSIDKSIEEFLNRPTPQRPPSLSRGLLRKRSYMAKGKSPLYGEEPDGRYSTDFPIGEIWASSATASALAAASSSPRTTVSGLARLQTVPYSHPLQVLSEEDVEAFLKAKKRTEEVAARIRKEVVAAREGKGAPRAPNVHAQSSSKKATLSLPTSAAMTAYASKGARSYPSIKEQANSAHCKALKPSIATSDPVRRSSSSSEDHLLQQAIILQRVNSAEGAHGTKGLREELLAKGVRIQLVKDKCKRLLPTTSSSMVKRPFAKTMPSLQTLVPSSASHSGQNHDVPPKSNTAKLATGAPSFTSAFLKSRHLVWVPAASAQNSSSAASKARQEPFVHNTAAALGLNVSPPCRGASQQPHMCPDSHETRTEAKSPLYVASKKAERGPTVLMFPLGPMVRKHGSCVPSTPVAKARRVREMTACSAKPLAKAALAAGDVSNNEATTASTFEMFSALPVVSSEREAQRQALSILLRHDSTSTHSVAFAGSQSLRRFYNSSEGTSARAPSKLGNASPVSVLHAECNHENAMKLNFSRIFTKQRQQQFSVCLNTQLVDSCCGECTESDGGDITQTNKRIAEERSCNMRPHSARAREGGETSRSECAQALQAKKPQLEMHELSCDVRTQKRPQSAPSPKSTVLERLSHENHSAAIVTQHARDCKVRLGKILWKKANASPAASAEAICTSEPIATEALTLPLNVRAQERRVGLCAPQLLGGLEAEKVQQLSSIPQDSALRKPPTQEAPCVNQAPFCSTDCAHTQRPSTFAEQCRSGPFLWLPPPFGSISTFPNMPRAAEGGESEQNSELSRMLCKRNQRKRPQTPSVEQAKLQRAEQNEQWRHLQEEHYISSSPLADGITSQIGLHLLQTSSSLLKETKRMQDSHSGSSNDQSDPGPSPATVVVDSAHLVSGPQKQRNPPKTLAPDSEVHKSVTSSRGAWISTTKPETHKAVAGSASSRGGYLVLQSRVLHGNSADKTLPVGGPSPRQTMEIEKMGAHFFFGTPQPSRRVERYPWSSPVDKPDQAVERRRTGACNGLPKLNRTRALLLQVSQAYSSRAGQLAKHGSEALQNTREPLNPQNEMQNLRQQLVAQRGEVASSLEKLKLIADTGNTSVFDDHTRGALPQQQLEQVKELQKQERPKLMLKIPCSPFYRHKQETGKLLDSYSDAFDPAYLLTFIKGNALLCNVNKDTSDSIGRGASGTLFIHLKLKRAYYNHFCLQHPKRQSYAAIVLKDGESDGA
ncbi:hypothetical protein Esti_001803 [Eimeria stiedai]